MTMGIFCLLLRKGQKQDKKLEVQLFLAHLLVLLALASRSCVYLVSETLALGLILSLAISGVESIVGGVAVGLLRWS